MLPPWHASPALRSCWRGSNGRAKIHYPDRCAVWLIDDARLHYSTNTRFGQGLHDVCYPLQRKHWSPENSILRFDVRLPLRSRRRRRDRSTSAVDPKETLALPQEVEHWSLTTRREKLIKIGAKVVRHGRYVTFQLAEVAVPRELFRKILSLIDDLRRRPVPA